MREKALIGLNYSGFVVLAHVLCALQASLWLQVFGQFPPPYFWLPVLCYWILYRSVVEGLLMTYLITYVVVSMSGVPLSMAIGFHIAIYGTVYVLRDRVLWSGPNSFMLACAIAAFVLPIYTFILSQIFETHSLADFHFFHWIMSTLNTAMASLPLYYLFSLLDRLTEKEPPRNTESQVL